MRDLDFYVISEQSDLFSIAPEWQQLLAQSASPNPMLDPSWLLLWWRKYGAGAQLAVGMLYDDGELVGIAPLCLRKFAYLPGLVFRRLQFLGVDANEIDGVGSTYMNFIARPGYEGEVADRFIDHIAAGDFGFCHEVMLGTMSCDFRMSQLTRSRCEAKGLRFEETKRMTGYFIDLPHSWEAYLGALSSAKRSLIQEATVNFERWAGANGGFAFQRATTPDEVKSNLSALFALNQVRWNGGGRNDAFSSPRFAGFHSEYVSSNGHHPDGVEIAILKVAGAPIAVAYALRNGRKVLAYRYGRTTAVPADIDLGIVVDALMIKAAIERGDKEFDFMGVESRCKACLATNKRRILSIRVARLTGRELVRVSLINSRDTLKAAVAMVASRRRRRSLASATLTPAQR